MRLPSPTTITGSRIFSFMGIGPKKTWDAITASAYEMDPGTGKWTEKRPVPGVAGRLAASAVALHDQVFIFGGYVVDAQGGETTVSDLNVFVPVENRYYRGQRHPRACRRRSGGASIATVTFSSSADGRRRKATPSATSRCTTPIKMPGCRAHRFRVRRCSVTQAPSSATPSSTWTAHIKSKRPQSQVRRVQRMLDGQDSEEG